ncbi:tetratricopeptide repeat protein [Tamlana flava]|uniref:tetratricopeptide repeat protein n=1 Tax=Tamlana flava TaxID=3158572 RepID=UPI00351B9109
MGSKLTNFFKELKRRKVYKVATVYAITSWLIIQIVGITFPHLNLPDWMITAVIVFVILGFPVALVLAWAFELSPDGIVKMSSPEAENNPLPAHKRKPFTGNLTLGVLFLLLIGQFIYFKFYDENEVKIAQKTVSQASMFPQKSIAVLPFKNLSSDKENEYFSDGVMEAILNNLSRIRDLKVVSRTSVERYRNDNSPNIYEIATNLEVANVLAGSVQKVGDNVRINVELIAGEKENRIWANNYDRDISDIFTVQSEIAKTIAENLEVILTTEERQIIENAPTANLKAYDLFLKATSKDWQTKDEIDKASNLVKKAITLDSNFAWSYRYLGHLTYRLKEFGAQKKIWADSALVILDKAIKLDPADAWSYLNRSYIYHDLFEFDKQEANLNLGLQYDPNNVYISYSLGIHYLNFGEFSKGIDYILKWLSVNKPDDSEEWYYYAMGNMFADIDSNLSEKYFKEALEKYPNSTGIIAGLCWVSLINSEFEETLNYVDKWNAIDSENHHWYMAYANFFLKNYDLAETYYLKDKELVEERDTVHVYESLQRLAYAQLQIGKTEEGVKNLKTFKNMLLSNLEKQEMTGIKQPGYYDLGAFAAYENDKETAYDYLKKSWEFGERGRFFRLVLMHDPFWDNLRGEEWFQNTIKKFNDEKITKEQLLKTKLKEYHARNELKWIEL